MSHSLFPIKAADSLFMTVCNLVPPRLPKIHNQQSLMLCWHSFSRSGRERIAVCFAYEGCEKFFYDCLQPISGLITQDARQKIIDARLTLMLMYCIVNICWHRWFDKYIFGFNGCLSVRWRLNLLAKPSPVIFMHRPLSFYQNWYISLNITFHLL